MLRRGDLLAEECSKKKKEEEQKEITFETHVDKQKRECPPQSNMLILLYRTRYLPQLALPLSFHAELCFHCCSFFFSFFFFIKQTIICETAVQKKKKETEQGMRVGKGAKEDEQQLEWVRMELELRHVKRKKQKSSSDQTKTLTFRYHVSSL